MRKIISIILRVILVLLFCSNVVLWVMTDDRSERTNATANMALNMASFLFLSKKDKDDK